jgi:hypothetical protein
MDMTLFINDTHFVCITNDAPIMMDMTNQTLPTCIFCRILAFISLV